MARSARLKRISVLVDRRTLERAKKALGASTQTEAVRVCLERVAPMEGFWRFMRRSRHTLRPGSIKRS